MLVPIIVRTIVPITSYRCACTIVAKFGRPENSTPLVPISHVRLKPGARTKVLKNMKPEISTPEVLISHVRFTGVHPRGYHYSSYRYMCAHIHNLYNDMLLCYARAVEEHFIVPVSTAQRVHKHIHEK